MGASGGPGACGWPYPSQPVIVTQPRDQTGCLSNWATFTVLATGQDPSGYQWYFNTNTFLHNATNASLTLTNLQYTNAGQYHVVVSNVCESVKSDPAQLEVLGDCPPRIVTQPRDQKGCVGGSATFTVAATGAAPLSYQWYFNTSTLLLNATNATLTLTNLQYSNTGPYQVVVSNSYGSANASAQLHVYNATVDVQLRDYFGFQYAGVNVGAQPGWNYELRCTTDLRNTNFSTWPLLERKAMTDWTWFYFDMDSPRSPQRFYSVKRVP